MKREYDASFEFWAALFALIAAAFWFWSAYSGFTPSQLIEPNDQIRGLSAALQKLAHLNAAAALFSGLSAVAMFASILHRQYASPRSKAVRSRSSRSSSAMRSAKIERGNSKAARDDKTEAANLAAASMSEAISREAAVAGKRKSIGASAGKSRAKRQSTQKDDLQ